MIINPISWRVGDTLNWSNIFFTRKKLFHLVFFNSLYINTIIRKTLDKNFFFLSKLGLSFIWSKIFIFSSNVNIIILLNQTFKIKKKFFKKVFRYIYNRKLKKEAEKESARLINKELKKLGVKKKYKIPKRKILLTKIFIKKFFRFSLFYFFYFPLLLKIKEVLKKKLSYLLTNRSKSLINFFFNKIHNVELGLIKVLIEKLFKKKKNIFKVNQLLKKILLNMVNRGEITGFRFLFAGRFSRQERAVYKWETISHIPFASKTKYIDYISIPVFLRYGSCSVHIWVNR